MHATQTGYLFSSDPNGTSTSATDRLWAVGVIDVDPTGTVKITENPNEDGVVSALTLTPIAAVPEPPLCALFGGGLVAFALLLKRKHNRSVSIATRWRSFAPQFRGKGDGCA